MTSRARRQTLGSNLAAEPKASKKKASSAVNPPRGEKSDFLKITVTLDPTTYELIATEAMRRKMNKEKDARHSSRR